MPAIGGGVGITKAAAGFTRGTYSVWSYSIMRGSPEIRCYVGHKYLCSNCMSDLYTS
jgi:hypothetical protein